MAAVIAGFEVKDTDGFTVSTVQPWIAGVGSTLPAASFARTANVWGPFARALRVAGEVQAAKVAASWEHSKVLPASVLVKAKVAEALLVSAGGLVVIVVSGAALSANVAVTDFAPSIVTVQVPVPEQGLPQPLKLEPCPAVAVSVTELPPLKLAEQVDPQSMPAGELVTVPVPVPFLVTVRL